MKSFKTRFLLVSAVLLIVSGCASYRTSSNIDPATAPSVVTTGQVIVTEGTLEGREYDEIDSIEVSVKKLTAFHKNPTKEQANEALIEKARIIGADAVIKVTYKSGVGMTTWGYMDAKGVGVKLK